MSIQISTTFNSEKKYPYFSGLTKARPEQDSNALWYRLPNTLKGVLKNKQEELIGKIKIALSDKINSKNIIKEVFVELLLTLETGFTNEQVIKIVENLDKFNSDLIVPITKLENNNYLLEEFHGPTDAFKDIALQMVTSMVSIIVEEENKNAIKKAKTGVRGQKLKFVITQTSTSGDTGPAGGSGIEGKDFVMNVIGYPEKEATYAQKGQMIILGGNVLSIAMNKSFSNIQETMLKSNTPEYRIKLKSIIENELQDLIEKYGFEIEIDAGSFNSINPGRVDGQTIYHSFGMLQAKAQNIIKDKENLLEVIPSGNGGHMYSVLMARLMNNQEGKTIVTCNRNNMFYKIIHEGIFKKTFSNSAIDEPSVSMIIEYPNNMLRLFSYAFGEKRAKKITDTFFSGEEVILSIEELVIFKDKLGLESIEVSGYEELETIGKIFEKTGKLVCPHTANAIKGLEIYRKGSKDKDSKALISATASPWKFLAATAAGLSFKDIDNIELLYKEYKILENSRNGVVELLNIIKGKFESFGHEFNINLLPENLKNIYLYGYEIREICSPDEFGNKTLEFLEKIVASKFREQVKLLIG